MELELVIRLPVGGATLTIPTRQRIFDEASAAGGRLVDSVHVAALDGLTPVELVDGRLYLTPSLMSSARSVGLKRALCR